MSKSILVIDTPEFCEDCICGDAYEFDGKEYEWFCRRTNKRMDQATFKNRKPDWCSLEEIPQRASHPNYCDNGRYDKGWNDCIDEILKEND